MYHDQKAKLIKRLKARGGQEHLVMFLTGFASTGKSMCVVIAQQFCFGFCPAVSIAWNDNMFLFTATTGSATSLFGGQAIHDAAYLNGSEKNTGSKKRQEWCVKHWDITVHIIHVDECYIWIIVANRND